MLTQALPRSAEEYARKQRVEIAAAVAAVRRLWGRVTVDFDESYLGIERALLTVVTIAQERVAQGAQEYIPAVLRETGQRRSVRAVAEASVEPLLGFAGDGRPLASLLYQSVVGAKTAVAAGGAPVQVLERQASWMSMSVGTALSDTGRQSEALGMGVRNVTGYVRMLNPPSCSRCVVLAGKRVSTSTPFLRHPGCDCRHIPASESVATDLTVNPAEFFDSLSREQQDATFGRAGAEAIRSGADLGQVVNARRGMRSVQIGGRDVLVTSEGTTRRGQAYRRLVNNGIDPERRPGARYRTPVRPRLMPETIAQVATDRADYMRLLAANGYLA